MVMKRMHWSEQDYLSASVPLIEAILLDMAAEGDASKIQERYANRTPVR